MNNLNYYIQEKLRLGKDTNVKDYLTFDEFKNKVNKEIVTTLNDDLFNILDGDLYLGNKYLISKLKFIDITNNKKEINFYETELSKYTLWQFKSYFVLHESTNGFFISYINTHVRNINSNINNFRYAYIKGKNYKQIDNVHIFSIEL